MTWPESQVRRTCGRKCGGWVAHLQNEIAPKSLMILVKRKFVGKATRNVSEKGQVFLLLPQMSRWYFPLILNARPNPVQTRIFFCHEDAQA